MEMQTYRGRTKEERQKRMKAKWMAVVLGCAAVMSGGAATYSLAPVDGGQPKTAKTAADDTSLVKVTGRGVGTNRAAALKDAYRDAVERAVGLYVDAEQMVKNDEIVSDKILTQSNAYIEKCDIVKETSENGVITVKILAEVKRRDLVKRITDTMPPQTYRLLDGGMASAHANMVSEAKRNADAAALMADFLKDFDPIRQLMTVGLDSPRPILLKNPKDENAVGLAYLMKIEVNRKKYFEETVPKLKQVLDQISLTPPKTIRFADRIQEMDMSRYSQFCTAYKSTYMNDHQYGMKSPLKFSDACYVGPHAMMGNIFGRNSGLQPFQFDLFSCSEWEMRVHVELPDSVRRYRDCSGEVFLITAVNATSIKALRYTVDAAVAKSIADWQRKMLSKTVEYAIVFKDSQENEIGGFPWVFKGVDRYGFGYKGITSLLMNTGFLDDISLQSEQRKASLRWFVTPFMACWADQYVKWKAFTFKADDIPNIASVSIELAE